MAEKRILTSRSDWPGRDGIERIYRRAVIGCDVACNAKANDRSAFLLMDYAIEGQFDYFVGDLLT